MGIFREPERWQSGRMRVFAKDVSGQKLDRGFESRPLRWLDRFASGMTRQPALLPAGRAGLRERPEGRQETRGQDGEGFVRQAARRKPAG